MFNYNTTPPQYLISPKFEGTTAISVSFWFNNKSSNYTEKFQVGYSTTTNDVSAFTWGEEIEKSDTQWEQYEDVFPTGTKYVAVRYNSNDMYYLYLDNFSFEVFNGNVIAKPTGLEVTYDGGTEATVRWTSDEETFDIEVNGVETDNVANPFTLTGLEYATTYTIRVRAKNTNGVSGWSAPASFSAIISDDMCQIKLVLTDSYGDGWNGAAIQITDAQSGIEIGTYANQNLDGQSDKEETQTIDVDVPNNRDIQFTWKAGNYDNECSYTAYDINDEVIFSGSGAMSDPITWHVSCVVVPWKAPSDLAATEITSKSAKLSWTENSLTPATAWVVAYKAETESEFTYVNVTENSYVLTGLAPETSYTVKVRPNTNEAEKWSKEFTFTTIELYPPVSDLAASHVTATSANISWTGNADSYNIRYARFTFFDDFENGLDAKGWTIIRNAEGDEYSDWRTFHLADFNEGSIPSYSGNYVAMSRSWTNTKYNVDNWLNKDVDIWDNEW